MPRWAARLPLRPLYGPVLYYLVLIFSLTVTWLIEEKALFLAGVFIYGPLTIVLATTIVMRWREGQKSSVGNVQSWHDVIGEEAEPSNGRGSVRIEAVWKEHDLE
jgi:hypothetical protein